MGEIKPSDIIIGFIVFSIVIGCIVSIFGLFMANDNTWGDVNQYDQFNRSFNKINQINSTVSELQTKISNVDSSQFLSFGTFDALVGASWNVLSLLPTTLSFIGDAMFGLSTMFGVPSWIIGMIILILIVIIVFAIYSAIFRKDI